MKLDRTEIGVIIAVLLAVVTINSWWRVKEVGRRARIAAQYEASGSGREPSSSGAWGQSPHQDALQDAGAEAD